MSVIEAPSPTVTAPVTRRDVLHRAADLIEEWGWTTGIGGMPHVHVYYNGVRAYCLLGALAQAEVDFGLPYRDYSAGAVLGATDDVSLDDLFRWNDSRSPRRGKRQVVARLREAAELA